MLKPLLILLGLLFVNIYNEARASTERIFSYPAFGIDAYVIQVETVPNAPSNLVITSSTPTSASFAWNDNSDNETGFRITRRINGAHVGSTNYPANATSGNMGLLENTTYTFVIQSFNLAGTSANVSEITFTTSISLPVAPSALTATASGSNSISLSWADNASNEVSYIVESSPTPGSGFTVLASLGADITSYTHSSLNAEQTLYYRVKAVNSAGSSAYSNEASLLDSLPPPWFSQDIGGPSLAGSSAFINDTFTLKGAGADIWNSSDQFRYMYQSLQGDVEVIVRVESLGNTNEWAKAGIMVRETLGAGARNAFLAITPGNGINFQQRYSTDSPSSATNKNVGPAPWWLRLVRNGNEFTAYDSPDGIGWSPIDTISITMGSDVYAGLAVTSHNTGSVTTAIFTDLSITTGVSTTPCGEISTIPCPEVIANLPFTLEFDGNEGGLKDKNGVSGTGFKMAVVPSAPLETPTGPAVPGYEPSKLEIASGKLRITTTAGIMSLNPSQSTNTNSQVNALGVGVNASLQKITIETTLANPPAGTNNYEQGGLWYGLDEDNYVKLVVVATSSGMVNIELLKEVDAISDPQEDHILSSAMDLGGSMVKLRLHIDPQSNMVEGFLA